jgi:hypothetical protein
MQQIFSSAEPVVAASGSEAQHSQNDWFLMHTDWKRAERIFVNGEVERGGGSQLLYYLLWHYEI